MLTVLSQITYTIIRVCTNILFTVTYKHHQNATHTHNASQLLYQVYSVLAAHNAYNVWLAHCTDGTHPFFCVHNSILPVEPNEVRMVGVHVGQLNVHQ